jgi:hypothetical protein
MELDGMDVADCFAVVQAETITNARTPYFFISKIMAQS